MILILRIVRPCRGFNTGGVTVIWLRDCANIMTNANDPRGENSVRYYPDVRFDKGARVFSVCVTLAYAALCLILIEAFAKMLPAFF